MEVLVPEVLWKLNSTQSRVHLQLVLDSWGTNFCCIHLCFSEFMEDLSFWKLPYIGICFARKKRALERKFLLKFFKGWRHLFLMRNLYYQFLRTEIMAFASCLPDLFMRHIDVSYLPFGKLYWLKREKGW